MKTVSPDPTVRIRDLIKQRWASTDQPLTGDEQFYVELLLSISRRIRKGQSARIAPANYVLRTYHLWDEQRLCDTLNGLVHREVLKRNCSGKYRIPSANAVPAANKRKANIARRTQKPVSDDCTYCRRRIKPGQETVDHVVPKSRGGSDDPRNLVVCCKPCNERKANRMPHEWARDILYFDRPQRSKRESPIWHAVRRFQVAATLFITSIKFWGTH